MVSISSKWWRGTPCTRVHPTGGEALFLKGSSKKHRQLITASEWPAYDPRKDPGMDVSDSVQLWRAWLLRRRIEAATQGATA